MVYCAVGSESLNKIRVKRRYRFDFHTKWILWREQYFFNFLHLWIYCLYPSSYSETYKWAGSQLRMTATLTCPTFRVTCDLLTVSVMARLMQLYRLFNTLRTGSFKLFKRPVTGVFNNFDPSNAELNPICYLLALLAHHFLHVSRIMVKSLTLKLLMSYIYVYIYIYGAPILDVSRSHTTTQHSR